MYGPLIDELIDSLRCLPGVGPKSAQRMALNLLEKKRDAAHRLAHAISEAAEHIGRCQSCRTLTESECCETCSDPRRDQHKLCVVETPADFFAIEQSGSYRGRYFVLLGHLSPLDGIGPEAIGIDQLMSRLDDEDIQELILQFAADNDYWGYTRIKGELLKLGLKKIGRTTIKDILKGAGV